MVNFNNGTKMMVNRCMELLNAKIARAQTRHIAKRVHLNQVGPGTLDYLSVFRERQKPDNLEESKRLSMWEQNRRPAKVTEEFSRLDQLYYKHSDMAERTYDCTWNSFPENPQPKKKRTFEVTEKAPVLRRKCKTKPNTAKPWDAEAEDFIKQWDTNNPMINRNRYGKPSELTMSGYRESNFGKPRRKY